MKSCFKRNAPHNILTFKYSTQFLQELELYENSMKKDKNFKTALRLSLNRNDKPHLKTIRDYIFGRMVAYEYIFFFASQNYYRTMNLVIIFTPSKTWCNFVSLINSKGRLKLLNISNEYDLSNK